MLVRATKDEIAQYMDFAYELALDQTKSGYPLWSDGVSTKEQFVERVWKSYEAEDRDLLLFVLVSDEFPLGVLLKMGALSQTH